MIPSDSRIWAHFGPDTATSFGVNDPEDCIAGAYRRAGAAPDEWRPSTCLCPLLLGESAELQVVAGLGFYHVRRVADQEFVLVFRRQVAEEYIHYEAVLEGYEAPGQESGWR